MAVFNDPAFDDHERVLFCRDAPTGLFAIIALHSTALGPAAGGCRLWSYADANEALYDVLRLSQGMSYKNAMAGLRFGGGKAVIIKTPGFVGTEALYERFGAFVDTLGGDYITAEDVGMTMDIMQMIARKTRHVTGLPPKSGKAGGGPVTQDSVRHIPRHRGSGGGKAGAIGPGWSARGGAGSRARRLLLVQAAA